jgi:hypothetical protein
MAATVPLPTCDRDARRVAVDAILECRLVRRAVARLRRVRRVGRGPASSSAAPGPRVRVRSQGRSYPSNRAPPPLVAAEYDTPAKHVAAAATTRHPAADSDGQLPLDVSEAVEYVAERLVRSSPFGLAAERDAVMREVRCVKRLLRPVNALVEGHVPPHVAAMPCRVDVALLRAMGEAAEVPDRELAPLFAVGFQPTGDVAPSGWWPTQVDAASVDLGELDHAAWVRHVERAARDDLRRRPGDARVLWDRTLEDCAKRLYAGPFTRKQLDAAYGAGRWRPMQRFGVLQGGKVRPCDNARASLHNAGTSLFEKLCCDGPDFSARAAMAFADAADALGVPTWPLAGGTDDLADAYRHIPCDDPRLTCVVLCDPASGEPAYFCTAGFPFGLKSSVMQFNRLPEATTAIARRMLGIVCTHFYDDFAVVEPSASAAQAQRLLGDLHALIGIPFAARKHVAAAATFVFLGVETDFTGMAGGYVVMRVRPERVERLVARIDEILDERRYPPSVAASLCGALQFTLSWVGGRIGRACMQPLFGGGDDGGDGFTQGVEASLRYLRAVLPQLPPHRVRLRASPRAPALVFSDGACEQDGAVQSVGFVVALPRPGLDAPPGGARPSLDALRRDYTFVHGSADVPADLRRAFLERKQQIGQVEIVGAIVPYLSVPELAGRDVIHFVDNTSAVAALTKGYSRVPDSARLVHSFHAWCAAARAHVWFEYVPSAANVADRPSRELALAARAYACVPGAVSRPRAVRFPSLGAISDPRGWMREAAAAAQAAECVCP